MPHSGINCDGPQISHLLVAACLNEPDELVCREWIWFVFCLPETVNSAKRVFLCVAVISSKLEDLGHQHHVIIHRGRLPAFYLCPVILLHYMEARQQLLPDIQQIFSGNRRNHFIFADARKHVFMMDSYLLMVLELISILFSSAHLSVAPAR